MIGLGDLVATTATSVMWSTSLKATSHSDVPQKRVPVGVVPRYGWREGGWIFPMLGTRSQGHHHRQRRSTRAGVALNRLGCTASERRRGDLDRIIWAPLIVPVEDMAGTIERW